MKFEVPNIKCGGCARGVTAIIKDIDENADVQIDVDTKIVDVITSASLEQIKAALEEDGFPPKVI